MVNRIYLISDIEQINMNAWRDFVFDHPDGNIFQTPEMYEIYKRSINFEPVIIIAIDNNEKILGLMLAEIEKEGRGILGLLSSRSIIYGGPLIKDNNTEILFAIISFYEKKTKKRIIYTQIRNFQIQQDNTRNLLSSIGYAYKGHLNIVVNLKMPLDDLWKGVKRNRKDGINKGKKQGFFVRSEDKLENMETFYHLFVQLYNNVELPYPDVSLFENLNLLPSENIKWFILDDQGKAKIVLCALLYHKILYAFAIGIQQEPEFLKKRPVDFFYWEVLKWGVDNKMEYFDWMGAGSPDEDYGVRDFKIQYGGEMSEYGRYLKIHKPILYEAGKIGVKIYKKVFD